ncbi:10803_t:CDS:2, partial [Dentiscutata heterogama]
AATESFVSEITSDKSKLDRISISSNDESVQRQLGVLSYESDDISESGIVFDLSSISKLPWESKKIETNTIVSNSFEDEIAALNNSLKDNLNNSSLETNNESNIFSSNI